MTEEDKREIEQYIDDAIDRALEKIQKKRYMKESSRVRYAEVSSILFSYYREGMKDEQMTKALSKGKLPKGMGGMGGFGGGGMSRMHGFGRKKRLK